MTSYPPPPGGQPPYGYGYGQPVPGDSNQGVWALVVAIVSIPAGCCCGVLGLAGGIVAVVLARAERSRLEQWGGPYADTSMVTAAFWVGVAAIVLGVLGAIVSMGSTLIDLTTLS